MTSIQVEQMKRLYSTMGTSLYGHNKLTDMRLIASHPYLLKRAEPDGLPVYGEHLVLASGKM